MPYRIASPTGGRLDIVDAYGTALQRALRRSGLSGYEPATAATLLTLFERGAPGLSFLDVGANIGLYSLLASIGFESDSVVAVEPVSSTADVAESIALANGADIDVVRVALSEAPGDGVIHLADAGDVSHSLVGGFKASTSHQPVPLDTLDALCAERGITPNVIKIDVEGHEGAVLRGARRTLARRPDLVLEVLPRRSGAIAAEINDALAGLGYLAYPLSDAASWKAHDDVRPIPGDERDWLLTSSSIDSAFLERWAWWRQAVARCDASRNDRLPVLRTIRSAYRVGGVSEIRRAASRFIRSRRP